MDKPERPAAGTEPKPCRLPDYTAADLNEVADLCEERKEGGFIVTPDPVHLFAEALRALARERANG